MSQSESNRNNPGRPTLCRSCGAIVGAGEARCAVCGASTAIPNASQARPIDRETIRFARAVLNRPYKFTIILLVANLFVYLLMWQSNGLGSEGLMREFSEQVLLAYGAKQNYLITAGHQFWRLLTPVFVHVNLLHLLVNMYSLWILGPYVEKLYGSAKFVVFWVLTGIAGVVASYLTVRPSLATNSLGRFLFKDQDVLSAGASGALFGLIGVLFVFGIKYRHELPEGFKQAFGKGMVPIILINLFIGYLGKNFIDNSAHLGGLISGGVLALFIDYRRPGERSNVALAWRVLQVVAIALVLVSFGKVAQHLRSNLANRVIQVQVPAQNSAFLVFARTMNDAQETFWAAVREGDVSNIDHAITALDAVPPLDPKADDLRTRLKTFLTTAKNRATATPEPRKKQSSKPLPPLEQQFLAWQKEYNEWLKVAVRTYTGIVATGEK